MYDGMVKCEEKKNKDITKYDKSIVKCDIDTT